jgi:hypothetical protein
VSTGWHLPDAGNQRSRILDRFSLNRDLLAATGLLRSPSGSGIEGGPTLSGSEFADLLETDVLIPYRKVQQRFSAQLKQLRAEEQPFGRIVQQYMDHRARCWQLRIESIREDDPAKALQSHEEQRLANQLRKRVWGTSE